MRYLKLVLSLSAIFSLLLISCDKKSSTEPTTTNNNTGSQFVITIGSGTNPTYSWTVGNAFSVSIVRTAAPTVIVWGLASPGTDNISSPVSHGTAPLGIIPTANTEPTLTAGVEYRISITQLDGTTGWAEFTP